MKPEDAIKAKNTEKVWKHLYGHESFVSNPKNAKFQIGDAVRMSRVTRANKEKDLAKNDFEKSGWNWSQQIYYITGRKFTNPITYTLKDYHGKELKGSLGEDELQKTKLDGVYLIDKILKKRTRNGMKEVYVQWLGYPEEYNTWEPESEIMDIA